MPKVSSVFFIMLQFPGLMAFSAILEPNLELAVPFFKNVESPFPSGQFRKSDLLQSAQGSFTDFHFIAKWGDKNLEVQNSQILREIDVTKKAMIKKAVPLYLLPEMNASHLTQLSAGQVVEIESLRGAWARVEASEFHKGYVLISDLETLDEDPGAWVSLTDLILKKSASPQSPQILIVPKLTRVEVIAFNGDYALVKTKTQSGWVPFSALVGRVDFAEMGWNRRLKKWEKILYRTNKDVIIFNQIKREFKDYSAYKGLKTRAIISGSHPSASLGARIELVEPVAQKWTQSLVKDHGAVWWKTNLLEKNDGLVSISTAELLKKSLNGISYDSKTKKGLASAHGIYRTTDGKTWAKIPTFGQDDWPVLLHPDGAWFVGPYRSTDEGVTFKPTVKWSELAKLLQGARSKAFMHFRVIDIQSLPKSQVLLKVDTGITVASIKAHVLSDQWTLLK